MSTSNSSLRIHGKSWLCSSRDSAPLIALPFFSYQQTHTIGWLGHLFISCYDCRATNISLAWSSVLFTSLPVILLSLILSADVTDRLLSHLHHTKKPKIGPKLTKSTHGPGFESD
ncbi:hypothetical protein BDN70DRAFT_661873 [Pholiota conissans]|uniref:Uncharacterized protein n=1 Tax=Pholiota conissans TaxID=109636 RepID=A0A9P6CUR2_9AGAR|nr:hypothetical protein BDN70DRAFT_661873 [Pholiota conissans]